MSKSTKITPIAYEKVLTLLQVSDEDLVDLILQEKIKPLYPLCERFKPLTDLLELVAHDSEMTEAELLADLEADLTEYDDFETVGAAEINTLTWVYLRHPTQVDVRNWHFQLASYLPDSVWPTHSNPHTADDWFRIKPSIKIEDIRHRGGFLECEVNSFRSNSRTASLVQNSEQSETAIDPSDEPEELQAANITFQAFKNKYRDAQQTPKNWIKAYLEANFKELNETQIERISVVINPSKEPGRKKGLVK